MKTSKKTSSRAKPKLIIRNATISDIENIIELCKKVYPGMEPYRKSHLLGQMNAFPEGQFLAIYEGHVVGYCSTFITSESMALSKHTWTEITGSGHLSRHNPTGDMLYGADIFVDPDIRGIRIGQRLYNARKGLCINKNLKGIVFAGRAPGFSKRKQRLSRGIEEYVELIQEKKIKDPVISFQLRNDFEIQGVLPNYLPIDKDSEGYGIQMLWRNPRIQANDEIKAYSKTHSDSPAIQRENQKIRVGSVQYRMRKVTSFEEFAGHVEYFVDVVADYRGDFVVFPELFAMQLLSIETKKLSPMEAIEAMTKYTLRIKNMFCDLAVRYNINIIGGSHPTRTEDGSTKNIAYVFLRDGSIHEQVKIHPTPSEAYWWNIEGGDESHVIQTDCGPIGVMICYDSEFPEVSRHLIDQGAKILFVPFCTDERQGYLRVRYCCQARAVENQCYVVMSGNVGNLPGVENMDIQYAQSCILTPCDFPFARDGIAADTTPNVEMVAFADLDLGILIEARNSGTVQNLKGRRYDLYKTEWKKN